MESKSVIGWLKIDDMLVNPCRFRAMIISCDKKKQNKSDLNINNSMIISSVDSATLLGIEIDKYLNFEKHFSTINSFPIFLSS